MGTKPEDRSSSRPVFGSNASNPLLPAIVAAVVLCSILTTVFTAARLFTKRLSSAYDLNDYILMLAWVAVVAFEFCLLAAGLAGLGLHPRKTQYIILDKYIWALEILYLPAIWLAKASLLLQMIHIFASTKSGPVYRACHVLIWANLAFYISTLFPIIFECHPIWKFWISSFGGHCINWKTFLIVSGALNVFSDLLILLLAVCTTWHMQMTQKRKAGVIACFATGLLAFISGICRLVYTAQLPSSPDISYIIAETMLWGLAEISTTILCTCFPTMSRFVQLTRDRFPHAIPSSPSPIKHIRKSKIFLIGNAQSSTGIIGSSGGGRPLEEVDMVFLNSPYQQIDDVEGQREGREGVVQELGSKKTVGIEVASRHQMNTKSCVASIV